MMTEKRAELELAHAHSQSIAKMLCYLPHLPFLASFFKSCRSFTKFSLPLEPILSDRALQQTTMQEFLLLFRQSNYEDYAKASPEKMTELTDKWNEWISSIIARNKLVSNGVRLSAGGKVLKSGGVVTEGPFVEVKEKLGSFIIVKAEDIDDAVALAYGCPAIDEGGSVEIRAVNP
jgi:hypothetical protein